VTAARRSLVLAGLTLAVLVAGVLPAWASFTASVPGGPVPVSTGTVAPPTGVTETDRCTTTTTTVERVTTTDPTTGRKTTSTKVTQTQANSETNVESSTTTTKAGPGPNQTTTTTVTKDTDLLVTVTWTPSVTPDVSGYLITARLNTGEVWAVAQTPADATSFSARVDASYLEYEIRLQVTSLTPYRWTATSPPTAALTC